MSLMRFEDHFQAMAEATEKDKIQWIADDKGLGCCCYFVNCFIHISRVDKGSDDINFYLRKDVFVSRFTMKRGDHRYDDAHWLLLTAEKWAASALPVLDALEVALEPFQQAISSSFSHTPGPN